MLNSSLDGGRLECINLVLVLGSLDSALLLLGLLRRPGPRSCAGRGAHRHFQWMGWQSLQPLLVVVHVDDLISPVRRLGFCWEVFEVYFEFCL